MGHMQHRAILDIAARSDADAVDIATHDRARPHRRVFVQFDITDNNRVGIDIGIRPSVAETPL